LYEQCRAGAQINFPESGRGLGHVTPTIFGSTVGYPSGSLASCSFCCVYMFVRTPVCPLSPLFLLSIWTVKSEINDLILIDLNRLNCSVIYVAKYFPVSVSVSVTVVNTLELSIHYH